MKIVYALLVGIMVFSFAGAVRAQGEDPYSGSYTCSGEPQQGCGTCTDLEIDPPSGMIVKKVSGNTYELCPQFDNDALGLGDDDCKSITIQDGVGHWTDSGSGEGSTFTGQGTATFDGSTIKIVETGKVTGKCNCDINLNAVCTR
jgi:hypothetical protein